MDDAMKGLPVAGRDAPWEPLRPTVDAEAKKPRGFVEYERRPAPWRCVCDCLVSVVCDGVIVWLCGV